MSPEIGPKSYSSEVINKVGVIPWLTTFLNGEGNNPELLAGIRSNAKYYISPREISQKSVHRIAGPEEKMHYKSDPNEWEQTVESFVEKIRNGDQFPPLIVVDFIGPGLSVADGNRRYEALKRSGSTTGLAVFCLKEDPRNYGLDYQPTMM